MLTPPVQPRPLTDVIGDIPYRIALAGGWIDQPFISELNPDPCGSMVVIGIEPNFPWMERAGIATGTRKVIREVWGSLPDKPAAQLVRELYELENKTKAEPSGSQDMIGLIYPGVCRLDYDVRHEGGLFPKHIEQTCDADVARWVEKVIHVIPVVPRTDGYSPLGQKNLSAEWVQKLGQTGKDCYRAILAKNTKALGDSMNRCMTCWETLLPHVVRHPNIPRDLMGLLGWYQRHYPGAMYSGCGGGYLFVASDEPVPGAFQVTVRTK
jgi:hypothetical protein